MVTALALQLIQCVIKLPTSATLTEPVGEEEAPSTSSSSSKKGHKSKRGQNSNDVVIVTSFENALRTGYNFLTVFLQKCTVKSEEDYRPMFENFVQDLLSTVNKPEWPSSELLLSLLGKILVKQFSNKSVTCLSGWPPLIIWALWPLDYGRTPCLVKTTRALLMKLSQR